MRATLLYGAGDVRIENVPDSVIKRPTDALVRVTAACVCGSDLWPYGSHQPESGPARMGHEFIGIVEDTGAEVTTVKPGDLVVAPFAISDNTCEFCREGLHTSCSHPEANFWDGEAEEGDRHGPLPEHLVVEGLRRHAAGLDEFTVQGPDLDAPEQVSHLVERAVVALERPAHLGGGVFAFVADAVHQEIDGLLRRPLAHVKAE